MAITPLQTTISRLDKSLRSEDKDVCRRVVDKARPYMAIRQSNKVTVCMCCGNSMVYSGNERFVKCCECGRTVEIIEEEAWLSSKRSVQKYFATVDVVEGIQLMRTYDVVLRYSAINRLKMSLFTNSAATGSHRTVDARSLPSDTSWAHSSLCSSR